MQRQPLPNALPMKDMPARQHRNLLSQSHLLHTHNARHPLLFCLIPCLKTKQLLLQLPWPEAPLKRRLARRWRAADRGRLQLRSQDLGFLDEAGQDAVQRCRRGGLVAAKDGTLLGGEWGPREEGEGQDEGEHLAGRG